MKRTMTSVRRREACVLSLLALAVLAAAVAGLFVGPSRMTLSETLASLRGQGSAAQLRILRNIRIPRILAAVAAGAGLSVSGLIMQTTLHNPMASPSTLGVSNAAVFGANLSIIAFAGGFLATGNNLANYTVGANPYAAGAMAFLFSTLSVLLVLGLCRVKNYSPNVVVLAGVAIGALWTAATTMLQFYATDVGISAAVIWNFGDLGRATWRSDGIMLAAALLGTGYFALRSWHYNALLSGEESARSLGVEVERLRFVSLLLASLITAVCVSCLGVIGFVGIICPHVSKKLLGQDHRVAIPASALGGSLLLLLADTLSRSAGRGTALPVGAITSLLGAPFFLWIIFSEKEGARC